MGVGRAGAGGGGRGRSGWAHALPLSMATGPSAALYVEGVRAWQWMGSSFVMRGDVCGSQSRSLPAHLQQGDRFLRGRWGFHLSIPTTEASPTEPILRGSITHLFGIFNHFLAPEPQTHSRLLHPKTSPQALISSSGERENLCSHIYSALVPGSSLC